MRPFRPLAHGERRSRSSGAPSAPGTSRHAQGNPRVQRAGARFAGPRLPGRASRRIAASERKQIVALAGARPDTLGEPFTRWSLVKLAAYLRKRGICEISPAHLGRVLARAGLSFPAHALLEGAPRPRLRARGRARAVAV
jgi:hypothetical protein